MWLETLCFSPFLVEINDKIDQLNWFDVSSCVEGAVLPFETAAYERGSVLKLDTGRNPYYFEKKRPE